MKNPSRIDFKNAHNYTIHYTIKLLESLINLGNLNNSIKTLNYKTYKHPYIIVQIRT